MSRTKFCSLLLLPGVLSLTLATAGLRAEGEGEETPASKSFTVVKKFVGFIRYKKYDQAMNHIGVDSMARYLLDKGYEKAKPDELEKFKNLLAEYIRLKAFPLALQYFEKIDLAYDQPVIKGKESRIKASLLYRGSEKIVFTWVLTELDGVYLITDFLDPSGMSSMQTSRDKQIQPFLQKKGMAGVISALEKQVADLKK